MRPFAAPPTTLALAACAAVATLAIAAPSAASAAEIATRTFRQSFPAGQGVRLANLVGRVDLSPAPEGPLTVEVTVHARGGDAAETAKLLGSLRWTHARDRKGRDELALSYPLDDYHGFCYPRLDRDVHIPAFLSFFDPHVEASASYMGDTGRIYARERSGIPILFADIRIGVPPGADFALRNLVGLIEGGELQGNIELDTASGDVRLGSLAGHFVADSGSGDWTLGTVRGETAMTTGSGDIRIDNLIGNGTMTTGSGDVVIERVAVGSLRLRTGSGDVTVSAGSAASVFADTGSGNVHLAGMDLESLAADTRSGDVTVQTALDRARHVSIETASGDVRIAGGAAAAFDLEAHQGSGDLVVGYRDAVLRHQRDKVVGARRGDGHTSIQIATHSGDCVITPR